MNRNQIRTTLAASVLAAAFVLVLAMPASAGEACDQSRSQIVSGHGVPVTQTSNPGQKVCANN